MTVSLKPLDVYKIGPRDLKPKKVERFCVKSGFFPFQTKAANINVVSREPRRMETEKVTERGNGKFETAS